MIVHRASVRLTSLVTSGALAWVALAVFGPVEAAHGESASAPDFSAQATASLVDVAVARTGLLPSGTGRLGGLRLAATSSTVDSGAPARSTAAATYASGDLSGSPAPDLAGTSAKQSANDGRDNPKPTLRPTPAVPANPALAVRPGVLRAHARWNDATLNPPGAEQLAEASSALGTFGLLPPARGGVPVNLPGLFAAVPGGAGLPVTPPVLAGALATAPSNGYSQTRTDWVSVEGQDQPGLQSTARISGLDLTFFPGTSSEIGIHVVREPLLTVTAAGSAASRVTYESPVLVVQQGSRVWRLDEPGETVSVPATDTASLGSVPVWGSDTEEAPGQLALLRVGLGKVTKSDRSDDRVAAQASTFVIEVLGVEGAGSLAALTFGDLAVDAEIHRPGARPDIATADGDGAPGLSGPALLALLVVAGMLLVVRFLVVVGAGGDRRRPEAHAG
jgi:hypothetical protein